MTLSLPASLPPMLLPPIPLLPYRLSLLFLLLAITLPFLGAHHYQPVATFHQEWLAGMLGLAAVLPLAFVRDSRPWEIPRTALLPLMLAVLVWIQFATGGKVLFESIVLLSLYLVWAFVLMLALCRIESALGRDAVADALAWSLLAGSLLEAATGALQQWAPWIGMPYIFPRGGSVTGNLAQANNFADYLWLGIASAFHLQGRSKLGTIALWLTLPALLVFFAAFRFAQRLSVCRCHRPVAVVVGPHHEREGTAAAHRVSRAAAASAPGLAMAGRFLRHAHIQRPARCRAGIL